MELDEKFEIERISKENLELAKEAWELSGNGTLTDYQAATLIKSLALVAENVKKIIEAIRKLAQGAFSAVNQIIEDIEQHSDENDVFATGQIKILRKLIQYENKFKDVRVILKVKKHTVYRKKLLKKEVYYEEQILQLEESFQETEDETETVVTVC